MPPKQARSGSDQLITKFLKNPAVRKSNLTEPENRLFLGFTQKAAAKKNPVRVSFTCEERREIGRYFSGPGKLNVLLERWNQQHTKVFIFFLQLSSKK